MMISSAWRATSLVRCNEEAVGELDAGKDEALVLVREKAGRNAFARYTGQDCHAKEKEQTGLALPDGSAADSHVAVSGTAETSG